MTTPRPTVFIVDDDETGQRFYRSQLCEQVTIISATSLKEAEEKWEEHSKDVFVVVMSACVDNITNQIDTIPLVKKIRETFKLVIIAASNSPDYRKQLVQEGCSHQANKMDVPVRILEVLGL